MITFSIIICTYNRQEYIKKCLESIRHQSFSKENYELVIVNNKSTDNTDHLCQAFISESKGSGLNITYVTEQQQGLSYARNRGILEAKGDFLIFLDDDAFADKEYLKSLNDFYVQNKDVVSAYGGKILPYLESEKPKWMSSFLMPLMSVINLGNKAKPFPKGKYPIGANMGIKAKMFKKYGGFNTELGRVGKNLMGGEEKDMFDRIRKHNEKIVYLPDAFVHHVVPDSRLTKDFIKKQALGIGISEKVRVSNKKQGNLKSLYFAETFKWGASIILFLFYTLTLQYPKAKMIIKFRTWVTKGILKKETPLV